MTKHIVRQRRGVAGIALCNGASNCRWPRNACPDHKPRVIGIERGFSAGYVAKRGEPNAHFGTICDGKCNKCNYAQCSCAVAKPGDKIARLGNLVQEKPEHQPAVAGAPADDLPEGWRDVNEHYGYYVACFEHTATQMLVWQVDGSERWRFTTATRGGCNEDMSVATRAEAMAAALGSTIYEIHGDNWSGWCWKRGDDDCCTHPEDLGNGASRADWPTAEAAALAALKYDADQRRKAAQPERDPSEIPPGWFVIMGGQIWPDCYEFGDSGDDGYRACVGRRKSTGLWDAFDVGGSRVASVASMHEAMCRARWLSTVEELWSADQDAGAGK